MQHQQFAVSGYDLLPSSQRELIAEAIYNQIEREARWIEEGGLDCLYTEDAQWNILKLWKIYNQLEPRSAIELHKQYSERGLMGAMYRDPETGEMSPDITSAEEVVPFMEWVQTLA